jgi:HK97 family phage prohead protease
MPANHRTYSPDEKVFKNVSFKVTNTSEDGIIEAIVSVFGNVDSYGEAVMPGAFAESLSEKLPKGVWMHEWDNPVSTTLEARELMPYDPLLPQEIKANGGLYIKGQFYKEITDSWQAYLKIKAGLVDEFSIGYSVKDYQVVDNILQLFKVKLFEWSPVLVGANSATAVLSVKSQMKFSDDLSVFAEDVMRLIGRVKDRKDFREKAGRVFSASNVEAILKTADSLDEFATLSATEAQSLRDLVAQASPTKSDINPISEMELLKLKLKMKGII